MIDQPPLADYRDPQARSQDCVNRALAIEHLAQRVFQEDTRCAEEQNHLEEEAKKQLAAAEALHNKNIKLLSDLVPNNGLAYPQSFAQLTPAKDSSGTPAKVESAYSAISAAKIDAKAYREKTPTLAGKAWITGIIMGVVTFCFMHEWALFWFIIPIGFYAIRYSAQSNLDSTYYNAQTTFRDHAIRLYRDSIFQLSESKKHIEETIQADSIKLKEGSLTNRKSYLAQIEKSKSTLRKDIAALNMGCIAGEWSDSAWINWSPASEAPNALRLGEIQPSMPNYQRYFPSEPILIPALVNFKSGKGILLKANQGMPQARDIAESLVLRLLANLPPASVRFTFIDPVSLGRNVAGFMTLEKFEAGLIGGKAWSDQQHIDRALTEITEHMETVIQKYLREEFKTIEDYNSHSRVKEAYRVIMVFDFPVNFSEASAKRLASILRNGPPCGVFPIIFVDTSKPLPYGFDLRDLERFALTLELEVPQGGGRGGYGNR